VKLNRAALSAALCLLALAGAACFGGGSSNTATDVRKVPTATLPAKLPDVTILGSSAVQSGGASSYTVKDGDTLAGIAAKLDISLEDLRAANPSVDPSTLRVGQSLKLPANLDTAPPPAATATPPAGSATPQPAATATPTPEAPATEAPPTEAAPTDTPIATVTPAPTGTPSSLGQTYVVQEGDFPAKIAEKFGITLEEFLAANPGLNPTDMHIGDVVIIPPKQTG
jgi:LysM repeat protein